MAETHGVCERVVGREDGGARKAEEEGGRQGGRGRDGLGEGRVAEGVIWRMEAEEEEERR